MQVVRFECPHCSANLKIRETDLVAKAVDCPECHQPIVIGRDPVGNLAARKPDEPSTKGKKQAKAAASSPTEPRATAGASSPRSRLHRCQSKIRPENLRQLRPTAPFC
jgi:hypothetical protein